MEPHGFATLGAIDKSPDSRDISLGAITSPTYTFAPTFTNVSAFNAPVEYQGQQPACGAHSGSKLEGLYRSERYSPRFTWANIKSFDNLPLEVGTDMRSIFKSLKNTGCLDFNLMGNEISLSLEAYATPTITQEMSKNAASHKAPGYGFWSDRSFNGLKQYISDHGAVLLLVSVGNEWWTAPNGAPSWNEKDIMPLRVPNPRVSGHFVVAHSYDEKYIYFINSFGPTWGRMGHGYFGPEYMPFVHDAGALITLAFNKDLYFGMTDVEVVELQKLLNKDARTRVAVSGAGSPGHETNYFGALTRAAVIKFQKLYSIAPAAGYVGPLTRAVLNGLADA